MTLSREETHVRQRVTRDRRLKCQRGHHREQLLSPHSNGSDRPSHRWDVCSGHVLRVYGPKASKMSQKACLEFVAAPQPARAARTHRSRVLCTQWDPGSAQIQQE